MPAEPLSSLLCLTPAPRPNLAKFFSYPVRPLVPNRRHSMIIMLLLKESSELDQINAEKFFIITVN